MVKYASRPNIELAKGNKSEFTMVTNEIKTISILKRSFPYRICINATEAIKIDNTISNLISDPEESSAYINTRSKFKEAKKFKAILNNKAYAKHISRAYRKKFIFLVSLFLLLKKLKKRKIPRKYKQTKCTKTDK